MTQDNSPLADMAGKINTDEEGVKLNVTIYCKHEWSMSGIGRPYCVVLEAERRTNGQLHKYQKQYDLSVPVGLVFENFVRECSEKLGGG